MVEADPRHFLLLENRLLVFHSPETRGRFGSDPGLMARAVERWSAVAAQLSR